MQSILEQIKAGTLKGNERLPSENELCQIHGVGRNTIRRAISELVDAGALQTVPGVGTFVVDTRLEKTAEYLFGFTQEMALLNKQVTSQVLEARLIPADATLSRRLQVQLGAEVVFLYRIRLIEGVPMAIERSYLPHELCPGILSHDFSKNSLYDVLASVYGKRPDHAEQVIEASLATAEVCQRLELTAPAVVFVFHRESRMESGEVVEYVELEMRADRFRFYTNLKLYANQTENAFRKLLLKSET